MLKLHLRGLGVIREGRSRSMKFPSTPEPRLLGSGVASGSEQFSLRVFSPSGFRSELRDEAVFLQGRVKLYVKTLFFLFGLFGALGALLFVQMSDVIDSSDSASLALVFLSYCGMLLLFLVAWVYLRTPGRSVLAVGVVESLGSIVATAVVAASVPYTVHSLTVLDVLLVVLLILVTRAAFVPSSAWRSLSVGVVATATVTGLCMQWVGRQPDLDEYERMLPVGCATWGLLFSVATAMQSRVLYGLQQSVRAALRLGSYTLEAKLATGGMATVYKARHAMLQRPTVVKLLPPESLGEASARFEREVKDTARLAHPNIIQIYDYGTTHGWFYYAMEYIDGLSVHELTDQFGPLPAPRVVYILEQVAAALAYAHRAGLVHRDVKPGNILVSDRGDFGDTTTLLDFGLVKELDPDEDANLSRTNTLLGTPLYMAPECITEPDAVDARTDLYALGAVGFFMLTGTDVFSGATLVEVCTHHLHTTPSTPSERVGRSVCSDQLEAILRRCLRKSPDDRYASASALRDALRAVPESGMWNADQASAWWEQHREAIDAHRARGVELLDGDSSLDSLSEGKARKAPA